MKKILNQAKRKIKNENGESLAEVLIAVLVSALGMVLLASMITHSASIITRSKDHFQNYIEKENELVLASKDDGDNGYIKLDNISLTKEDGNKIDVKYYTNTEADKVIYTYKIFTNRNNDGS